MSELIKKIVNCETNEITERPFTDEEIKQFEQDKINDEIRKNNEQKKAAARQAILDRLGLTEEEARLLLG